MIFYNTIRLFHPEQLRDWPYDAAATPIREGANSSGFYPADEHAPALLRRHLPWRLFIVHFIKEAFIL